MNLIKTLALLICSLGISNVCLADSDVLSLEETIKLSSNIVKATPIFEQKIKIKKHIEYTLWEFKILKEFKGKAYSAIDFAELVNGENDHTKSIVVVTPTFPFPNGERSSKFVFKKGKEYILLLNVDKGLSLYTLGVVYPVEAVTTKALIEKIIELNKDI